LDKQRKKLDDYLREKEKQRKEEDEKERSIMGKRLKIEKQKQHHYEEQKKLIEEYRQRKQETESLLRISYTSKGKVDISTPEFQFNTSYMKRKLMDKSNSKSRKRFNKSSFPANLHPEAEVKIREKALSQIEAEFPDEPKQLEGDIDQAAQEN
jgi:hypothetical protein